MRATIYEQMDMLKRLAEHVNKRARFEIYLVSRRQPSFSQRRQHYYDVWMEGYVRVTKSLIQGGSLVALKTNGYFSISPKGMWEMNKLGLLKPDVYDKLKAHSPRLVELEEAAPT